MTSNDNSVNIEFTAPVRGSYHHGDLRSALIDAGLAALEDAPVDDLSLRALARAAGVSATAVYRHFPDKDALLAAMALAALDAMGEALQAAGERAAQAAGQGEGAEIALKAQGTAYVRYAIAHPQWFRLIWQTLPPGDMVEQVPGLCAEDSHPAMAGLQQAVAAVLPPDADADTRRATALHCWAVVHGLAMLVLDQQVVVDDAMIERVIGGAMGKDALC
jgi:AcrR family transcriptional regulator